MLDKDFLEGYEVGVWEFNPRIYKILALSVVVTLSSIFGLAQTNLLQSKACDGHYVGKVCQVLDTIYVGSKIFTGDNGYVVRDYTKTRIEDADVVMVDVTGADPKFTYPEGFFKGEETTDETDPFDLTDPIAAPITPPSSSPSDVWKPQRLPKKNTNPIEGELPDDILGGRSEKDNEEKNPEKDPNAKPDDGTSAENKNPDGDGKKPEKTPEENDAKKDLTAPLEAGQINKKALQDFADEVLEKWESKKVDLSKQFKVTLTGELLENGRLNAKRTRYTETIGNPEMIEVAKRAIESVGDSGWLTYLSRFDVKTLNVVFAQNDSKLMAVVDSELPNQAKAETVATGLRSIIQAAMIAHKNGFSKLKDDEFELLKAAKVSNKGNSLVINFDLDKPVAQDMIQGRLKEYQAKKQKEDNKQEKPTPNGAASKQDANSKAAK